MPQISPLQMTEAKSFSGLSDKNHLGAMFQAQTQKISNLVTRIHQTNFGLDLDSYLDQFGTKEVETNDAFEWDLIGTAKKNVPLVRAEIDGTTVSAGDEPGKNFGEFDLIFPEDWFTDVNIIVGEKNEAYPLQIKGDPVPDGNYWRYTVELITGDSQDFVPPEELAEGKRFSREWSLVEQELSKKGGEINFTSPFKMRNDFTMIRLQHTVAGDMINRPLVTAFPDEKGGMHKTWTQYEDMQFERQFREERNKALMFATSNRTDQGTFKNFGKSGNVLQQGSGLREQMEASNTSYYSNFTIEYLENLLLDLSEGKLPEDKREFVLMTGERGAVQFHRALEEHSQTWQPLFDTTRMYKTSGKNGKPSAAKMGYGFGGQFLEYIGPQGIKVNLSVQSLYDDRERNKIYHPDGGVAESYRYDILDVGTSNGEPNIQKVIPKGQYEIAGYQPGFRDPFSPTGKRSRIMAISTDGYVIHRGSNFGTAVKDPSRVACIIPSILSA